MIAGLQLSRLYWQISTVRLFGRIWWRWTSNSTSLSHVSWGPMVQLFSPTMTREPENPAASALDSTRCNKSIIAGD
jgi:hypothetical protein